MLNNFTKDSNNLFGKENRLIYFSKVESPFAGRINEQENFDNGEIAEALTDTLENLDQIDSNEVEPGSNMFHTLVELFDGNRNLAAEITDALDDDVTGFRAQFDNTAAMYTPENLFDNIAYNSESKELTFSKNQEVLFTADLETLRSQMYILAVEHLEEQASTHAESVTERSAVAREVQAAAENPNRYQMLEDDLNQATEQGQDTVTVRRTNEDTVVVPTEILRAEVAAQRQPLQIQETQDALTNLNAFTDQLQKVQNNLSDYTRFSLPASFRNGLNNRSFREMMETGRIQDMDVIQVHARALGMDLYEIMETADSNAIDASDFLRNTEYASRNRRGRVDNQNGNLERFVNASAEMLSRYDSLSTTERQDLQRRSEVLAQIVELQYLLTRIEETEATSISPDYITDVEFSEELSSQLDLRNGEFRGGKDEFGVLAIYSYIYGPTETLNTSNEGLSVRTQENGEQTVIIESIPPEHLAKLQEVLAQFPDLERLNIGIRGRRTLTRALEKLRSDSEFAEFREQVQTTNLERTSEERNQTARIETQLSAIFDVLDYGSTFNQNRRTLQSWEAEFDYTRGGNETLIEGQLSNFTKFSWILNNPAIVIRENGETRYDLNNLATTLTEYANTGKTAMLLDRNLVENAERLAELRDTAVSISAADILSAEGLNENLRQLIYYGATNQAVVQRTLTDLMEEVPPQTPIFNDLAMQMIQNGIPVEEIPALLTAAQNWFARIAQNEDGSIDNLEFGTSRTFALDRQGRITATPNASIEPNGEFAVGFRLTGNYIQTERARVFTSAHVGMREETMNPVENAPSVSVTLFGYNQQIGNRDWNMAINVGGTAGINNGSPVLFQAGIEFNQDQRALLRREFRETGNLGEVTFETIERVRNGERLSDDEIDQFLNDLGEDHGLNQSLATLGRDRLGFARTYVEMLAEAEMMDTISDASGVTFGAGGGFPAILYIKLNYLGREKTFFRVEDVEATQDRVSQSVYRQLAESQVESNPSGTFTIRTRSGEIYYDGETGRLETTMGISIEENEILNDTSDIDALNANEDTHGLHFERSDHENYNVEFSIDDIGMLANLGTNTEILVDPAAQVTIEALDTNRFGIRFNGTPNGEVPSGFSLGRHEITYPFGSDNVREVSITMSTRPTSAQLLRGNRFAQRIRVNEEGIVTSTRNFLSADTVEGLEAPTYGSQEQLGRIRENSEDLELAREASRLLAEAVGTEVINDSYRPREEVQRLADRLFTDEEFREQLSVDTTIAVENGSAADYESLVNKINEVAGISLSDADVQYILGRTIPGTFLTLSDARFEGRRAEQAREVAEGVFRRHVQELLNNPAYNRFYENGVLREFTDTEKAQITSYLVSVSTRRINQIAENIENLRSVNAYSRLNGRALFTTAVNEYAEGQREFIIGPATNMEYIEGSITQIDAPLVSDFIYNLYNPILPEMSEGLTREDINAVLDNRTARNLVSSIHNGVSVLEQLYGVDGLAVITELYNQLKNEGSVQRSLSEMTGLERQVTEHFTRNIINLRNNWRQHTDGVTFIESLDGENQIGVMLSVETGTLLIQPCGNLTMFAYQMMNTQYQETFESEAVAAAGDSGLVVADVMNQRNKESITIGLPTPRLRRPEEEREGPDRPERPDRPEEPPKDENNEGGSNDNVNQATGQEDQQGYEQNIQDNLF